MADINVIGAGAWGTAFALQLTRSDHRVKSWAFEPEVAQNINQEHENGKYLPGIKLPESLTATADIAEACRAELLVLACPAQHMRGIAAQVGPHLSSDTPLVVLSKGIEQENLRLMTEVLAEVLPESAMPRVMVLSGPNFAREVAESFPTDSVLACPNREVALRVQKLLHTPFFRVYTSEDVVGVQLGGALKNVIAIAAGVCAGLDLGYNAQAALITRGLAEITRLAVAKGANPLTFLGLAGMGDLVLTCTGDLSRNRTFGKRLGQGEAPADILSSQASVVEGYYTTSAAHRLARQLKVDMPITEQVHAVLYEGKSLQSALLDLLKREFKDELTGIVD